MLTDLLQRSQAIVLRHNRELSRDGFRKFIKQSSLMDVPTHLNVTKPRLYMSWAVSQGKYRLTALTERVLRVFDILQSPH